MQWMEESVEISRSGVGRCLCGEGQAEAIDVPAERTWRDRTRAGWRGALEESPIVRSGSDTEETAGTRGERKCSVKVVPGLSARSLGSLGGQPRVPFQSRLKDGLFSGGR